MSQTTSSSTEVEPTEDLHPADILLNLIIALLAPMFLTASNGDILFARMAALQTIESYRARTQADLIAVVQIIAFGLAALASLSRSMEDNLSLNMTLRLRGNANACNRSAEHNRRALRENRQDTPATAELPDEGFDEAELQASITQLLKQTGQAKPEPAPTPTIATPTIAAPKITAPKITAVPTASIPTAQAPKTATPIPSERQPTLSERQIEAAWAAGMARAAAGYTADMPNLPPAQRRDASIRAAALSSCAHDLLTGNIGPRPRPGDLAAIMRPTSR